MATLRKWWKAGLALVALFVAAQFGVSALVRTHRMHAYLVAHLERAFGRPVEVGRFGVALLPVPQLDAEQITVGEDPAFGNEYFLRADNLSASLRWTGLLRLHFEFGTLSFSRPSLILVRNAAGRWNLESWLPPPQGAGGSAARVYGPTAAAEPVNRLRKIEFDEGRVNFKEGEEKLPFAFVGVSGSVDQTAPGRWQLRLEAQPWRSGVTLQSAGTLRVQGGVAGTSARLQPAEINVHWEDVSLADLFRLLRGNDSGVRGAFTLDGSLKSGAAPEVAGAQGTAGAQPGDWSFAVEARATQIHRWDLGERSDNPRLRLGVAGTWNVAAEKVVAERVAIEAPRSNLRGTADYQAGPKANFELHVDSAGIQATDLLAWLRAFQPGIDEGVSAEQFFTGALTLRGWPVEVEHVAFSSHGGVLRVPGLKAAVRIGPVRGGRERNALVLDPFRVALGGSLREVAAPRRRRIAALMQNAADITVVQDLSTRAGSISIEGQVQRAEDVLKAAAAFGHPINHGWELTGEALAVLQWGWAQPFDGRWSGRILFNKAKLAVAGLNQPLDIQASTLNWDHGLRTVDVTKVNGFGGSWSGSIQEAPGALGLGGSEPRWNFNLSADRMNAADVDRWVGPRARPNWLQRLLSSFLGRSSSNSAGSALVQQINADGEVNVAELSVEKLKFADVHATASLRNFELEVHEADAKWAGGMVHAQVQAAFAPQPHYEVAARLDRVNLAEIPTASKFIERLAGFASGTVHLETHGVGRDELLQTLAGGGEIQLKNVAFRGWDVNASLADGQPQTGTSRWTSGSGAFTMRNRGIEVPDLRLEAGRQEISLQGSVSFTRDADLTVQAAVAEPRAGRAVRTALAGHVLKILGPLDAPRVSVEKATVRQPAD